MGANVRDKSFIWYDVTENAIDSISIQMQLNYKI